MTLIPCILATSGTSNGSLSTSSSRFAILDADTLALKRLRFVDFLHRYEALTVTIVPVIITSAPKPTINFVILFKHWRKKVRICHLISPYGQALQHSKQEP